MTKSYVLKLKEFSISKSNKVIKGFLFLTFLKNSFKLIILNIFHNHLLLILDITNQITILQMRNYSESYT